MAAESGPLSYGQLSVWRDVEHLPPERRHEANTWAYWTLPAGLETAAVRRALGELGRRHRSLHTRYDVTDPAAPRQVADTALEGPQVTEADHAAGNPVPALLARPFDLENEVGWRAQIVTRAGRPSAVALVKHHMTADGWCEDVLRADFLRLLHDPRTPADPPPGPLELARWQRGEHGARQNAAALDHWRRVLAAGPAAFPVRDAQRPLQCVLRSRAALAGGRALAQRLGASLPGVVLAAYLRGVAELTERTVLVAQLMSANRFLPRWRSVVTSMNQWTAAPVPLRPQDDFEAQVRLVNRAAMTAYRHGMYDVDALSGLRRHEWPHPQPQEATCAFNFLGMDGIAPAGRGREPTVVWEEPFSTIGPRCYLRAAAEGDGGLTLRLRVTGISRQRTLELLTGIHDLLVAEPAQRFAAPAAR
jgi:hypothetical protein